MNEALYMQSTSYFPTGIVTGEGFCDRDEERALLKKRLAQNAHVVLISPRRYGKSSLIAQFTMDQKLPYSAVDLLPATSGKFVRNAIVDGVANLIDNIIPTVKKSKEKILSYFSNMNAVIELSAFGQRVKFTPLEKSPEESIIKILLNLDKVAIELNKKLIFVIDEFQQISNLEDSHSLEASIRHAVERSKNVFYVFSGSNRTLLEAMFKNKERPLYHLCDEIKINRINKDDYFKFIEKAAQKNWRNSSITSESINQILNLTECHPYYVNRLCRNLWDLASPPQIEDVIKIWNNYVEAQKLDWVSDVISKMTVNQRSVMAALSKEPEKEFTNKNFIAKIAIAASSIQRTIHTLLQKDFIFRDHNGYYQVLNPVIKWYLAKNEYFE